MTDNQGAKNQDSRMVVCSKHGLMYDASKRGGCERCIREWERQRASGPGAGERGGFPTSVKVLGLVLVVAGLYVFFTRSETQGPPPGAAPATPQPVAGAGQDVAEEASERALEQIVADVPDVIGVGRQETERLLASTDEPERRKQDWEFWTLEWNARLQQLTDQMPPQPDPRDRSAMALAFQEVNRILHELRSVPRATQEGLPDSDAVEQHFVDAEKALQQARVHASRFGE